METVIGKSFLKKQLETKLTLPLHSSYNASLNVWFINSQYCWTLSTVVFNTGSISKSYRPIPNLWCKIFTLKLSINSLNTQQKPVLNKYYFLDQYKYCVMV